jgi:hypothetical protein
MSSRLLSGVALMFLCTVAGLAQTSRGVVTGVVSDTTGAVISGATVTLQNSTTGQERTTATNGEGFYRFEAVDLGLHSVKFSSTGFGELTKTNIDVQANQSADVPATLTPAGQNVTVDVMTEAGALIQTEAPVRGGNIDQRRIVDLPFAGRNPVALALTLPGVSSNRYGLGVGTFSVNGSRGRSNNFLIDGTENNDISVAGQGFQITNPDSVQEVSVQTSNYDSEFGRAGGAVVNTITKSGGNEFHGTLSSLFDVTRDDALTNTQSLIASNRLRGYPPRGTEQFHSMTFGGPLILPHFGEGKSPFKYKGTNRTFFFVAWQEQFRSSASTVNRTVLTPAGRTLLRSIFPEGANSRVDLLMDITRNVIGESSLQNIAIGARPGCAAPCNIQFGTGALTVPATYRERQSVLRIDHKIGENDQFSARYLFDDQKDPLGGGITFPGFGTANNNTYQNLLFTETHIFSSTWTNEGRIAYNRILIDFPNNPLDGRGLTLPRFDVTTLSAFGIATNLPQGRVANNYVLQDTLTNVRGNHTFRFGLDLLKQRSRQFAPIVERGLLTYRSSTGFTALANYIDDFGGSGGGTQRDFGSPRYYPFLFRQAYFFQDRWRASESLTLTLGLRYENFGNPINSLGTAAFTGLFNVDPVTFAGPYSQPNEVKDDNNNFSPSFGIAYSPSYTSGLIGRLLGDRKTVFRAGYQIGYDSFFNNIASNAATSSPNVVATSIPSVATGTSRGLANLSQNFPTTPRPLSPLDSQTLVLENLVNPYYQRWSAGVQRGLPWNLIVDASYVGSKGTKLYINEDLNPSVPAVATAFHPGIRRITPAGFTGSTTCTPNTTGCFISGRLDNLQGSRLIRTNGGSSSYHSGQFSLTRRFVNGFAVTGAYTWSKLIDNASEVFGLGEVNSPQQASFPSIFGGQSLERAVSFFDRRHRASITYVYAIPFMKEQRGFIGHVLGGFEISGVTTFESGVPLTVINGVDADSIGGNLDRPDFNPAGTPGTRAIPAVATATLNPCAVAVGAVFYTTGPSATGSCINPANAQYIGLLAGTGRRGTLGRNTLRTPGTENYNVNILKRIILGETTSLELRAEFYNIFNHPQYGQGSVSPFSPGAQGISASVINSPIDQFLQPQFADGGGRVVRYQLKFKF